MLLTLRGFDRKKKENKQFWLVAEASFETFLASLSCSLPSLTFKAVEEFLASDWKYNVLHVATIL
jgi:hypothetical protein